MKRLAFYVGPTLLLVLAGSLGYWHHHRLTQLNEQLSHAVAVLATENEQVAQVAAGTLRGIEANVEKNRNYPPDVARLRRAEALHAQVTRTLVAFRDGTGQVQHLAGRAATGLRHPAYLLFTDPDKPAARRWQHLRRQLTACTDSLRQAGPAAGVSAALPEGAPGVTAQQALADLAVAKQQLLGNEARVLAGIARRTAYRQQVFELAVLATADNNVVAPGDVYRARLLLTTHAPGDLRQVMACNGRPVPVDAQGIGHVRFRAPLRPGPATWTGAIRFHQNGRDTTFAVRVPYRVARR